MRLSNTTVLVFSALNTLESAAVGVPLSSASPVIVTGFARASELHTGAEIEAAFVEALHRAFTEDREPTELDLGEVLNNTVPLATTMSESIEQLRPWSKTRARHATHADRPTNGKGKLDLS